MSHMQVFLFGTLRDDGLRDCVLPKITEERAAWLPDFAVTDAGDPGQPRLAAQHGHRADGICVALDETALVRLDFYEGLFGYSRRSVQVQTAEGSCDAQIYAPDTAASAGRRPWALTEWQDRYGAAARLAAAEVFALSVVYSADVLRIRYPMLLAHASSRIRASAEAPVQAQRSAMTAGDVVSHQQMLPYTYFFAVQVDDLQFRRFDGTFSPVVRRAGLVMADAVTMLPYDPVRDCVMVIEQFRYGLFMRGAQNCWVLEPIAGRIDAGEGPRMAALREAQEEARLSLTEDALIEMGGSYPSPGAISEYMFHFIALCDLPENRTGVAGLESEAEDIRSHILPLSTALDMITSGEVQNAPLIQSLYWLALNRDRLRAGIKG